MVLVVSLYTAYRLAYQPWAKGQIQVSTPILEKEALLLIDHEEKEDEQVKQLREDPRLRHQLRPFPKPHDDPYRPPQRSLYP
jgi:hypothetical protein